jgi:sugar O-acyltransferase (sialic acid O-acetyltransferase NeuD family)
MIDVVILGAGGFAREACWVFEEDNQNEKKWNVLGFIDDNAESTGASRCDLPVLGTFRWLELNSGKNFQVISGVGNPITRRHFAERAAALGLSFCSVIHPSAQFSRWVEIEPGAIITAGCVLTTHIQIGAHTLVNLKSTIGHDAVIGPYCNINPGSHISGSVTLGEGVELGTGAVIIQGHKVGEWSVIGAGAVVTDDIPSRVTAVGVPCRVIKWHEVKAFAAAGGRS